MKILKLNHAVAEQIQQGSRRTLWSYFDNKIITVGDDLELIDLAIPRDKESWNIFGIAHVTRVNEVSLKNVSREELILEFGEAININDIIQKSREASGSNITPDSLIRIVYFDYVPMSRPLPMLRKNSGHQVTLDRQPTEAILYADGGSRGNPGPSASGYVLYDGNQRILSERGVYLGITTNNQAEYQALKLGLEAALSLGVYELQVRMDSLLVINQMKGVFKVRNRDLWPIHQSSKSLSSLFKSVSFSHVPRELNKAADAAVNRALDEALGITPVDGQ